MASPRPSASPWGGVGGAMNNYLTLNGGVIGTPTPKLRQRSNSDWTDLSEGVSSTNALGDGLPQARHHSATIIIAGNGITPSISTILGRRGCNDPDSSTRKEDNTSRGH